MDQEDSTGLVVGVSVAGLFIIGVGAALIARQKWKEQIQQMRDEFQALYEKPDFKVDDEIEMEDRILVGGPSFSLTSRKRFNGPDSAYRVQDERRRRELEGKVNPEDTFYNDDIPYVPGSISDVNLTSTHV